MNRVFQFRSYKLRHVRGTRIEAGQLLYAIYNPEIGKYFIWAYSSREFAETMASRVFPGNEADIAANWRSLNSDCVPSDRTTFGD